MKQQSRFNNSIDSTNRKPGSIESTNRKIGSINSSNRKAGSIDSGVKPGSVDSANLKDGSISSANDLKDKSIYSVVDPTSVLPTSINSQVDGKPSFRKQSPRGGLVQAIYGTRRIFRTFNPK